MLHTDRDALLCDLAETYHVYDFGALPVLTLAALSVGLRDDSRIKMLLSGRRYISPLLLQAEIADGLTLIRYILTAKQGDPIPQLYTDILTDKEAAARAEKKKNRNYIAVRDQILAEVQARTQEVNDG